MDYRNFRLPPVKSWLPDMIGSDFGRDYLSFRKILSYKDKKHYLLITSSPPCACLITKTSM
jgi:hypothetical protein